jgi:hypothetical protein
MTLRNAFEDMATAAKQDVAHTDLAAILAKLSSDPATQATLAAILAKLTSDPATQATLAAVLAKLSSDPSTGAKQDTQATKLDTVHTDLGHLTDGTARSLPTATAPGNIRKTVTTAGTAVPLNSSTLRVRRAVVCALSTNAGVVVVGASGVLAASGTRNSPYLNAGDSIELGSVDLAATYIDSTAPGEGVTVYYEA